ncbi:hypothetical protein [Pantoea sp. SORGH_AS_0659]|uniref:hypothetical protein n=1 Tax=Pantoea sp. SORGH_AS_0659 TaxID=3062597 RepID=UPI002865773C|nr:hypothetical protein [Pantoea sp. SORGH_AS_0659]MDR6352605.1 hypothetical protein [Pantoea sp. SORGH_AS_0659]
MQDPITDPVQAAHTKARPCAKKPKKHKILKNHLKFSPVDSVHKTFLRVRTGRKQKMQMRVTFRFLGHSRAGSVMTCGERYWIRSKSMHR